jgi:capsular polysaccharide transport system permease protein
MRKMLLLIQSPFADLLALVCRFYDRLSLQYRIVSALAERDFLLRLEKGPLGAIGLIAQPLLLMATLLALRFLVKLRSVELINPVIWMATGVTFFYMFSAVGLKAITGVKKSQDLFFYRRIRPLDTLLATAVIESRFYGTTLFLVIVSVFIWTWSFTFDDPGLAVLAFLLVVLLALGVGSSALVIGHRIPLVKLIMKFGIKRMLIWTSGIFFAFYTVPGPLRPFLLWNPLLHAVELFRHSVSRTYPIPDISLPFLATCAIVSCGLGLIFYSINEDLLLSDD